MWLTLMLTWTASSSSTFICRANLEVLPSTNLSLSCFKSSGNTVVNTSEHKHIAEMNMQQDEQLSIPFKCSTSVDRLSSVRTSSRFSASNASLTLESKVYKRKDNSSPIIKQNIGKPRAVLQFHIFTQDVYAPHVLSCVLIQIKI